MFNQDITIVNKFGSGKELEYKTYSLKGFWSNSSGITINGTSLVKNDTTMARILFSEDGYVDPKDYKGKKGTWTLRNDDYLIKDVVKEIKTISELNNYESMKITSVSKKDYGSLSMQHFEIEGS